MDYGGYMQLKLYVVPGSHPCEAVEQAIKLKGIPYKRIDLLPGVHVAAQLALFGKPTVPGIKGDGFRMVGSRNIMRLLDSIEPEPALFPSDPELRQLVEEAERWGDEVFQPVGRDVIWPLFHRDPEFMRGYAIDAKPIIPLDLAMRVVSPVIAFEKRWNKTDDETAQATINKLPDYIEQIDRWIDEGILGNEQPNAADLQIGSTIWLLRSFSDLEPLFADTQAADLARYFRACPGSVPAETIPANWIPA